MSFVKETIDTVSCTPEPSRRYVQWKEEDVGLLLSDLEQPGHYEKWKENKSGFSKRVAEQVFKNVMYHEAIKFKVRWLESRFKIWNEQLTSPEVINDELAIKNIREKMFKEFVYYDRCKPIFLRSRQPHRTPVTHQQSSPPRQEPQPISPVNNTHLVEPNTTTVMEPENIIIESPIDTNSINNQKRMSNHSSPPYIQSKKKKGPGFNGYQQHQDNNSHCIYGITEDRKSTQQMMELELELKKMNHQERMQEMKLEQLRLEIELQKLKRDTSLNLQQQQGSNLS